MPISPYIPPLLAYDGLDGGGIVKGGGTISARLHSVLLSQPSRQHPALSIDNEAVKNEWGTADGLMWFKKSQSGYEGPIQKSYHAKKAILHVSHFLIRKDRS